MISFYFQCYFWIDFQWHRFLGKTFSKNSIQHGRFVLRGIYRLAKAGAG